MEAADQYPTKPGGGGGISSQRSWALQQVCHRQALITHPPLHTTDVLPHGPPSFSFWSQMPGLDHGHFSLEGSRMHLGMDTAEPAGPEVSPALWIPENDNQGNTQAMVWMVPPPRPTHGARKEPAQRSPGQVGKGRVLHLEFTKGSRAALPDINMFGTALKRGANGIGGQSSSLDVGHEKRHLLSKDQSLRFYISIM